MALPPPDPSPRKKRAKKFVQKNTPPAGGGMADSPEAIKKYDRRPDSKMGKYGPSSPQPKTPVPQTLGKNPNNGQYRIPGLGEYGRKKNIKKMQNNSPYFGRPDYGNRSV